MGVGFVVVIVVADILVAIEGTEAVLFGEFPIYTSGVAHLLEAPGVEQFDVGIRGNGEAFLVVFDLQSATKHILSLTVIGLLLAIVGIVEITPTLTDGVRRTIGILPALSQGETEVTKEFLVKCQRDIEAMARCPILSALLRITSISIAINHGIISSFVITDLLIIIIEEIIASRGLEPLSELIIDTKTHCPTVAES